MLKEIIKVNKPQIPANWNYQKSVNKMTPIVEEYKDIINAGNEFKKRAKLFVEEYPEFLLELYVAHEKLDGRGGDRKSNEWKSKVPLTENGTFDFYCKTIKLPKTTAYRWLHKYFGVYQNQTIDERENIDPVVYLDNAIEWIDKQEPFDLLLTDPPYMTDITDINLFVKSWLPLSLSKLKSTGRAFICIGAYPQEIYAYLSVAMPKQILVWTYRNTLGPSPSYGYKQNWQAILYYEMPDAPPIDCPIMTEQFSVQDINAPDGRLGNRFHEWQKPIELAERFIRHSTQPGESVVDPFCCTGTFLLAASKLGRIGIGCDIDESNLDIAVGRGCKRG